MWNDPFTAIEKKIVMYHIWFTFLSTVRDTPKEPPNIKVCELGYCPISWNFCQKHATCANDWLHYLHYELSETTSTFYLNFAWYFVTEKYGSTYTKPCTVWLLRFMWFNWHSIILCHFTPHIKCLRTLTILSNSRAPSQYKDRLIYVWRFPC